MAKTYSRYASTDDPVLNETVFDGLDVLEIGAGTGDFTIEYLRCARRVVCLEPDAAALLELQQRLTQHFAETAFEVYQASIIDFPLAASSFDMAVFSNSF